MHTVSIRSLTPVDAAAYVTLRREMLADAPWAFAASPEDDVGLDPVFIASKLGEPGVQAIVGAWEEALAPRLIAAAGIHRDRHIKMSHRARIWGVYVSPHARGRGVGERIIAAALEVARAWRGVNSVGLSVSVNSPGARRLYARAGFREWGVEPGALVHAGNCYDEVHMCHFLEAPVH